MFVIRSGGIPSVSRGPILLRSFDGPSYVHSQPDVKVTCTKGLLYEYSSEARQAPANNDDEFVFLWNEDKQIYNLKSFDIEKAESRVTQPMLNAVFKDIHLMRLYSPDWVDPLKHFHWITVLLTVPLLVTYLATGLANQQHEYEIVEDEDKRFILEKLSVGKYIEIAGVATLIVLLGTGSWIFFDRKVNERGLNRLKRRAFIIKQILSKHEKTTLPLTGGSLRS